MEAVVDGIVARGPVLDLRGADPDFLGGPEDEKGSAERSALPGFDADIALGQVLTQTRDRAGIAAGRMTRSNLAGYVAGFPIHEVLQGLNAFTLGLRSRDRLAFVSGGSGATPMIAMLRHLADTEPLADVAWFHAARAPAEVLFAAELAELQARMPNLSVAVSVSRPSAASNRTLARMGMVLRRSTTLWTCASAFSSTARSTVNFIGAYPR